MWRGKKSYLVAIAIFAIGGLMKLGLLSEEAGTAIIVMLNGIGVATIRAAIGKQEAVAEETKESVEAIAEVAVTHPKR